MPGLYFEDFNPGDVFETEGATLTQAQIIDFALTYDPQPFHIDVVAAEKSLFGGLIASGFQTLALSFRLLRDTGIITGTGLGGAGGEELRWLAPVRPGDTIRVKAQVLDKRLSSRGGRGTVRIAYATFNQHGEAVLTVTFLHLVSARDS